MRPIHLVHLDKTRPAVILTRPTTRERMTLWTVAPVTTRIRGLSVEVPVGQRNGLAEDSVVSCDNVQTVPREAVGRQIGYLLEEQESALTLAITLAFDLA